MNELNSIIGITYIYIECDTLSLYPWYERFSRIQLGCDRQSGTLDWICEISVSYCGGMSPVLLRDHTPKGGDPVLVHGGIYVWHVLEK